jgi:hypothetical protein
MHSARVGAGGQDPSKGGIVNFPYLLELKLSASPIVGILVQARNKQAANSGGIHSKVTVGGGIWCGIVQTVFAVVVVVDDEGGEVVGNNGGMGESWATT